MESGGDVEPSQPLTEQEKYLKRNTDCVYFLASPLSCKKGSECEYRHSKGARFNPMDCWYWLNGNCLNPNCCYRHPPLDWPFEDPWAISMPFEPPSSSSSVLSTKVQVANDPDSHNISKSNVPCHFFQRGNCLKGDKCHFMHDTQPTDANTAQQFVALASSPSELLSGITRRVPKERSRESTPKENATEVVEFLPSAKSVIGAENAPENGLVSVKSEYLRSFDDELPQFQSRNLPLSQSRDFQFPSIYEHLQNGKDAEEFFRESSPGFDVLVDDPMEVSDYFETEDEYGGRNLNYTDDFNYHHPDYVEVPRLETGQHRLIRLYGMHENFHGNERCRTSFERVLERSSMIEKRKFGEESYCGLDSSDLRHKLLKLSRQNGSLSDRNSIRHGNPTRRSNLYTNEDKYRVQHFQRYHRSLPREKTRISRLKSRISVITRSPDQHMNLQSSVDTKRERYGRKSSRDRMVNDQWRFHPRMEWRFDEDLISCDKRSGLQTARKDDAASSDFPGPKSLAEIKGTKVIDHVENNESEMNHGVRGPPYYAQSVSTLIKNCEHIARNMENLSPKLLGKTTHMMRI